MYNSCMSVHAQRSTHTPCWTDYIVNRWLFIVIYSPSPPPPPPRSGREEGSVLFNDALNTFYLRLYGVRHMVKDHSDSEKGNPLPPHRLLFLINSKGSFICTIPQTG